MKITILGAGVFGQALGKILTNNGHAITFYDPFKYPELNLESALSDAEVAIIATPSNALSELVVGYPKSAKTIPTILATKGLLSLDLFKDFTQFSVLSGPAFAADIMAGQPATFTVSSPIAKSLFENDQITIELCDDSLGIILCGALKNVYAIGAGYYAAESAPFIENAHAELAKYLADHGAEATTANYACGIGDLRLTCTDDQSRNFTCGKRLAAGEALADIIGDLKTVEGVSTASRVANIDQYPILSSIKQLVAA